MLRAPPMLRDALRAPQHEGIGVSATTDLILRRPKAVSKDRLRAPYFFSS
jgi:hypothetical protein